MDLNSREEVVIDNLKQIDTSDPVLWYLGEATPESYQSVSEGGEQEPNDCDMFGMST